MADMLTPGLGAQPLLAGLDVSPLVIVVTITGVPPGYTVDVRIA